MVGFLFKKKLKKFKRFLKKVIKYKRSWLYVAIIT